MKVNLTWVPIQWSIWIGPKKVIKFIHPSYLDTFRPYLMGWKSHHLLWCSKEICCLPWCEFLFAAKYFHNSWKNLEIRTQHTWKHHALSEPSLIFKMQYATILTKLGGFLHKIPKLSSFLHVCVAPSWNTPMPSRLLPTIDYRSWASTLMCFFGDFMEPMMAGGSTISCLQTSKFVAKPQVRKWWVLCPVTSYQSNWERGSRKDAACAFPWTS